MGRRTVAVHLMEKGADLSHRNVRGRCYILLGCMLLYYDVSCRIMMMCDVVLRGIALHHGTLHLVPSSGFLHPSSVLHAGIQIKGK